MTYYTASQFKERWYIRFKDFKDGDWRISIEDPTYTSSQVTELTGAGNPFEWMGQRDEDQTACVCGSTGYVRIVVTDETKISGLRPSAPNDRRVTAVRDGIVMWQGFLKQEDYSQDWISAPYELELPIVSPIELCKDIPMPDYSALPAFSRMSKLLDYLIKDVLCMSGSSWYTNFGGLLTGTQQIRSWIYTTVCPEHFYRLGSCGIEGKSVAEVLESFFLPFGHICEFGDSIFIYLNAPSFTTIYEHVIGSGSGFSDTTTRISTLLMRNIDVVSTDNTKTQLSAPSSVEFDWKPSGNANFLKLKAEDIEYYPYTFTTRRYPVNNSDITPCYYFNDNLLGYSGPYALEPLYNTNVSFAQIIKGERKNEKTQDDHQEFTTVEPVCIRVTSGSTGTFRFYIKPKMGAYTVPGYDSGYLQFKLKAYNYDGSEVTDFSDICVAFRNEAREYLKKVGNRQFSFSAGYDLFRLDDNDIFTGNERLLSFKANGSLEIEFISSTNIGDKTYYLVPEMSYADRVDWSTTPPRNYFFEDVARKVVVNNGGCGNKISVTFDSRSRSSFKEVSGICHSSPEYCFLEEMIFIDLNPRVKLELPEVRYNDPTVFHTKPVIVSASDNTTYIPVAVGMNARDCTTKLTLVSNNL